MSTLLPGTSRSRGWLMVVAGALVLLIGYLLAVFAHVSFFVLFFVTGFGLIWSGAESVRRGRQLPTRPDSA
jgi:uncharacterized membrane protein HdeD (DUF308 family)